MPLHPGSHANTIAPQRRQRHYVQCAHLLGAACHSELSVRGAPTPAVRGCRLASLATVVAQNPASVLSPGRHG